MTSSETSSAGSGAGQFFSSRIGLLLSVLGIAVGTGNIWRFPRIAAQNGSEDGAGAFLIAWIIFLFAWSVPLIVAEYALGREGRGGTIRTFVRVAGERFAWMGAFVGFVAAAIMFYYSVVAGWCIFYLVDTLLSPLPTSSAQAMEAWNGFQGGALPVVFHALAMGIGAAICLKGISSIERANKVLVPALLVVVVVSVIRAVSLPGAGEGIGYLFSVDLDQLTRPQIWLEALTQNAWDTGAGWGLILTYAAYMQHRHGVVKNAFITGVGNNMVSMMAAVMVFGIVFATLSAEMTDLEILSIMQNSGPASTGLTFIWMPQLFARMTFGPGLAVLFFLGLSFAALSSLISMIELATRIFVDAGLTRTRAIGLVAGGGFVLGVPSALNVEFLGNQDFVWGVALMLSGAFIALAVRSHGAAELAERIAAGVSDDWRAGAWWRTVILYLVPLQAVVLLIWWMYLSATAFAPDRWFDPFDPYSVMTCLVQWGAAIAVFLVMNKRLASRSVSAV